MEQTGLIANPVVLGQFKAPVGNNVKMAYIDVKIQHPATKVEIEVKEMRIDTVPNSRRKTCTNLRDQIKFNLVQGV
jgi:hypothetical protein